MLDITCRVEVRLSGSGQPDKETRQWLEEQVGTRLRVRLRTVLERLQLWQADCIGLGPRAAMTAPGLWQRLREDWPRRFGEVDARVRVEAVLRG